MTLCIAAACREEGEPQIILLSDRRIETQTAGAEIEFKHRWGWRDWPALIAGDVSRADRLLSTFHTYFDSRSSFVLDRDNVVDEFTKPVQLEKYKLADEYVQATLGISYKDFLENGRNQLPDDVFRQMFFEITRLDLQSELIIAGFANNEQPCLTVIGRDCSVTAQNHFAAIGTGATIASSVLFQRKQREFMPLQQAIYHVFEAKKLGEIAPGVGQETDISIISPAPASTTGKKIRGRFVTLEGFMVLERWFKEFGPRNIVDFKPSKELFSKLYD